MHNRTTRWIRIAAALLALASVDAQAIAIYGASSGSFVATANCAAPQCQIVNTANGPNSQVQWLGGFWGLSGSSALTADPVHFGTSTGASNVVIGELTWVDNSIWGLGAPNTSGIDWLLNVAFTTPGSSSGVQLFNLSIANPLPSPGSGTPGMSLSDLNGLSFSLANVVVNDFRYSVINLPAAGAASNCRAGDYFWGWCGASAGALLITADFSSIGIPEPSLLLLLAAGLLGAGIVAIRHQPRVARAR